MSSVFPLFPMNGNGRRCWNPIEAEGRGGGIIPKVPDFEAEIDLDSSQLASVVLALSRRLALGMWQDLYWSYYIQNTV